MALHYRIQNIDKDNFSFKTKGFFEFLKRGTIDQNEVRYTKSPNRLALPTIFTFILRSFSFLLLKKMLKLSIEYILSHWMLCNLSKRLLRYGKLISFRWLCSAYVIDVVTIHQLIILASFVYYQCTCW